MDCSACESVALSLMELEAKLKSTQCLYVRFTDSSQVSSSHYLTGKVYSFEEYVKIEEGRELAIERESGTLFVGGMMSSNAWSVDNLLSEGGVDI